MERLSPDLGLTASWMFPLATLDFSNYALSMIFDPVSENEPLLLEIAAFCERRGMTPTDFGVAAINDRALVGQLKQGRQLMPRTLHRLRALLDQEKAGAA